MTRIHTLLLGALAKAIANGDTTRVRFIVAELCEVARHA
jgi:hypothetical protein